MKMSLSQKKHGDPCSNGERFVLPEPRVIDDASQMPETVLSVACGAQRTWSHAMLEVKAGLHQKRGQE